MKLGLRESMEQWAVQGAERESKILAERDYWRQYREGCRAYLEQYHGGGNDET